MRQESDGQIKLYKVVMWLFAFTAFFNVIYGEWLTAMLDAIIAAYSYKLYTLNMEIKKYFRAKDALDDAYIGID